MDQTWESLFKELARQAGHSDKYLSECLSYVGELHSHNVPVIFDYKHFRSFFSNVGESRMDYLVGNISCYKEYYIRKKSGGKRLICAPYSDLKRIQNWIYKNILLRDMKSVSPYAEGFVPKSSDNVRNVVSNAKRHVGCKWLINVDIQNFFDSIKKDAVWGYFKTLGYEKEVADILSKICTYKFKLPQGAPTSPMLSNLIVRPMDDELARLANKCNCNYSRYADDITFSGISEKHMPTIREIYNIIYKHNLLPNKKKTKISFPGDRQMVTGLTITNGLHVPKKYRKDIWKELYCCKKFGVENQIAFRHPQQGLYKYWLLGRIMFVKSVEPKCGEKMLHEFNSINWCM